MADDVSITTGAGTSIGADDIGGVKYQRVKLIEGDDGVNDGDISAANPLPVTTVNAGTFVVQENGPAATSLALIDDPVFADDAAFTHATSKVMVMGGTFQASPNTLDDNDAGALLLDSSHRLVPAPSAAQYVDDADWTDSSSSHVLVGGLYQSTPQAVTDGDVGPFQIDSHGNLRSANPYAEYETVAASQTAQVLGPTGAIGDYIAGVLVIPATTSPGNVLLLDNATSITIFVGGTGSVSTLHPFYIPLGMLSVSGAWKLTTGASVSCIGIGDFT